MGYGQRQRLQYYLVLPRLSQVNKILILILILVMTGSGKGRQSHSMVWQTASAVEGDEA